MYPFRTPLLWLKLRTTSNLNWSTKKNQTWTESGRNPKLSVSMSKEPDLEDFTTLSLLVVSVFSDSRRIGVDLTITVRFKNFDGRFEDFPVLDWWRPRRQSWRSSLSASFGGGGVVQLTGDNWAAVAASATCQLHSCCSELLEPCATKSSTLDPIHPKPWNLCSDTSC